MGLPQLLQVFPSGWWDADIPGDVDCKGFPQIPQNCSVMDSGLPHERQIFIAADWGGCREEDLSVFSERVFELGFEYYLNWHRLCHRIFPFQKKWRATNCAYSGRGRRKCFLFRGHRTIMFTPGRTAYPIVPLIRIYRGVTGFTDLPEWLALEVLVRVNLSAGTKVMVMYYQLWVMAREQTPEKELLQAFLADGFLRIAISHSSCRTLQIAGQPLSHIHDRMSSCSLWWSVTRWRFLPVSPFPWWKNQ